MMEVFKGRMWSPGSLRQASSEQAAAKKKDVVTSTSRISNQYQPAVSWAVLREVAVVVADADIGAVGVVVEVVGVEESSVGLSSAS